MADFAIQRDTAQVPNAGTSVTITAGSEYTAPAALTSAFIRLVSSHKSGTRSNGTDANVTAANGMCWIANPEDLLTSVNITRYGTTDVIDASWEIIEYIGSASGANEFIVRGQGAQEVTGTGTSGTTGAVSSIATDLDVVPWLTGQGSAEAAATVQHGLFRLTWNSGADTITANRQVDASVDATFSWAAVEFTGTNWTVELSSHTMTAAASTETETISTVALARAFIHPQFDTGDPGSNDVGVFIWLSDVDEVSFLTPTAAATGQVCHAWVISNSQTDGTPMVVARYSDTTNFTGTTQSQTVTAVTMAETTIEEFSAINAQTTSSSMCEVAGAELTTTTNVALWRSRAVNTLQYRLATVSWPTAAAGATIDAETDSIDVGGQAADLLLDRVLDAEPGAVSLSGTAADLERSLLVSAEGGAVSVTGTDATLTEVGDIILDAETDEVSVTGTDAGLFRSLVLSAEGGSVSVAGQTAFFALDKVGEAGEVTISGQDATLSIGRTLDAEAGSVTLAGTDATLLVDYVLDAEGGSVSVEGQDATLTAAGAFAIGAEEGAVAVAGQNVDLLRHYVLAAEAGSVGLSGTDVATPRDYLLAAALGAVSVSGQDATLQIGDELFPAPADIFGRTGRTNVMGRT